MIDHFEIKVFRFEQCLEFYSLVLEPLQVELKWSDEVGAGFGGIETGKVRFVIEKSAHNTASHIAFSAADKKAVNAFHKIGIASGYRNNGNPGLRENYAPNYYAAFLLDPDGNNIEAVVYI